MKASMKKPSFLFALVAGLLLLPAGRAAAQNFTNLYSFNNGNAGPAAGLLLSGNTFYGTTFLGGALGYGTVFALRTNGTGFANLYSFTNGSDGAAPTAGLVLSGNTLYGTEGQGSLNYGTVFALSTHGGALTNLYSFANGNDGSYPGAGLILSGNLLFGTAEGGGTNGTGTVFAIKTDSTGFADLHSFALGGTSISGYYTNHDGLYPLDMILSGDTLYGEADEGGTNGYGTIFALNTNGTGLRIVHTFTDSDGAFPGGGLVLSGNTLYGTTYEGGTNETGTVFAVNTDGTGFASLYSFADAGDGGYPIAGLVLSGNILYGAAAEGGNSDSGTVFALGTNGSGFTTLYAFTNSGDGANPVGTLLLSGNTLYGTTEYGGLSDVGAVFALTTIFVQFTVDQTNGEPPLTVNFSAPDADNYGNAITNWNWDFGDGSSGTNQNPSHAYTIPGTFSPTLVSANNNGLLIASSGPSITVSPPGVSFTANPTSGSVPLTVSFASAVVDSAGNPVTSWNWTFGDGATSAAQNPSHTYTNAGLFSPVLIATNNLGDTLAGSGPLSITITNAPVYSGLVQNGGFETGDFTGWAVSGAVSNVLDSFVDNGSQSGIGPLSGGYVAALGPVGSLSYLSQSLATSAGAAYLLSLWLDSPDGQAPNHFLVSWNGKSLFNGTNVPGIGWTNLQFLVTAAGTNSVLQFGFRDDPSYFGLDDVSLVPAQPGLASFSLSPTILVFNGTNGLSGQTYYVLASTNLALPLSQWTPVATNVLNASGNFTTTIANPGPSGPSQQFYILQLQ